MLGITLREKTAKIIHKLGKKTSFIALSDVGISGAREGTF
jgi:hypothetical protein